MSTKVTLDWDTSELDNIRTVLSQKLGALPEETLIKIAVRDYVKPGTTLPCEACSPGTRLYNLYRNKKYTYCPHCCRALK